MDELHLGVESFGGVEFALCEQLLNEVVRRRTDDGYQTRLEDVEPVVKFIADQFLFDIVPSIREAE